MKTHISYLTIIAALLVGFYIYEVRTPHRLSILTFNDGSTEINYETLLFGWQGVETNTQDCDDEGQCLKWWEPESDQTPQTTTQISWTPEDLIEI
jgi:hypothetical protein